MNYLSPTKSSSALTPEEVHLHSKFYKRPQSKKLDRSKPWSISMNNLVGPKMSFTQNKKFRSRSKRRHSKRIDLAQ